MSKPIAQITFFVLISLVLIAATSYGVRGWLGGTQEAGGAQSRVLNLQTLNQGSTDAGLETLTQPGGAHQDGGCQSDGAVSSSDY